MKYYEQLLESFDKLKKRTFKLTVIEEDVAQNQKARQELIQFFSKLTTTPVTMPSLAPGEYSNSVTAYLNPETNQPEVSSPHLAPNTSNPLTALQKQNTNGQRLVKWYVGEEEGTQTTTPEVPGQATITDQGADQGQESVEIPPEELARMQGIEEATAKLFPELQDAVSDLCGPEFLDKVNSIRELRGETLIPSCNEIPKYIAGNWSGSFQLKFGADKDITFEIEETDEDGKRSIKLIELTEKHDDTRLGIAVNNLIEVAKFGSDSDTIPDREQQEALLDSFSRLDNGSIVFKTDSGQGLVVRDKAGVITGILEEARSKVEGYEFPDYSPGLAAGKIAALRGKMLESLTTIISLSRECGAGGPSLACEAAKEASIAWRTQLKHLKEIHSWAIRHENDEIGIATEDLKLFESLSEHGLHAENLRSIFSEMLRMSEIADGKLVSDFVIPVGDIAAQGSSGDKADAIYVWDADEEGGCSRAVEGLEAKGYSEQEASKLVVGYKSTELAFGTLLEGKTKPALKNYIKDRFKGAICTVESGLKHVMKDQDTNVGISWSHASRNRYNNPEDVMLGEGAKHFAGENEASQKAFIERTIKYHNNNIGAIESQLEDLDTLKAVEGEAGKKSKEYDALDSTARTILDQFLKQNEYKDIISPNNNNLAALEKLLGRNKKQLKTKQGRAFVREMLSRTLMIARLQKDINAGSQDAIDFAKMQLFSVGGSQKDHATIESRVLSTGKMITMRHNEIIDFIKGATVTTESDKIVYSDPNDPTIKVSLALSRDRTSSAAGPQSKWRVDVSKNLLNSRGKNYGEETTQPSLQAASTKYGDVENMIQEYLDNQKDMLMKILSN
jgi:hypothetical protein